MQQQRRFELRNDGRRGDDADDGVCSGNRREHELVVVE
jgi:hypothetical protein